MLNSWVILLEAREFGSGKLSEFTRKMKKERETGTRGKDNKKQFFLTLRDQTRLRKLHPVTVKETVEEVVAVTLVKGVNL